MWHFWLWFSLFYVFDVSALIFCKVYIQTSKIIFLIIATLSFAGIIPILAKIFKYKSFAVANLTWSAANIIILPLIGWWIFQESLSGRQLMGIGLTLIGLLLVHFK